jgi:hypothetical protein
MLHPGLSRGGEQTGQFSPGPQFFSFPELKICPRPPNFSVQPWLHLHAGMDPAWSGKGGGGALPALVLSCVGHVFITQITVSHFVSNILFAWSWNIAPPAPFWPGLGGVHPAPIKQKSTSVRTHVTRASERLGRAQNLPRWAPNFLKAILTL